MPRLTPSQLHSIGFQPCLHNVHSWQNAGDVYMQKLPRGPAYVLCIADSEEVEAFIGNWTKPLAYIRLPTPDLHKLGTLLAMART